MVKQMIELTDEKLMAYVDGKLNDLETKEIREALLTNTIARDRVEIFKKSTILLQKVYDAPIHEEVPEHLIDEIVNFKADEDLRPGFVDCIISWLQEISWQPVHALAYSMILMIGIGTGWFAAGLSTKTVLTVYTPILQGGDFSRGLETTVSGMNFSVDDQHASVTPVTTFLDAHGHYCRQYEVIHMENKNSLPSYGVACRTAAGDWLTRVFFPPESSAYISTEMKDSYIPAGDDGLAATIFSNLIVEPPLTIEQEEDVIRRGWDTSK